MHAHVASGGVSQAAWERLSRPYDWQLWLEHRAVLVALELAAAESDDRLLDAGTGTGAVLRELARRPGHPREAIGVDLSPAMLARLPALPAGWAVTRGDVRRLPFAADAFDVAIACYVLHVLADQDLAQGLDELWRVLRPGGRLVSVTPVVPRGGLLRPGAVMVDAVARHGPAPIRALRSLDPRPALKRAGFSLVRARTTRTGYPSLCVLAQRPAAVPRAQAAFW